MVETVPLKVASIFLDIACAVHKVAITTGVSYSIMISSKSGVHISGHIMFSLDRVFLIYAVTNTTGVNCSFVISSKSGLHISGPSILSTYRDHYNWSELYLVEIFPPKVASIFLDLVCLVYAVTITTGLNCSFVISSKKGFHNSGLRMFSTYSNH